MALEDLLNLNVTSASRKAQRLSEVPAAVHVITQEDIRRSGATSLPEALRLVPGVHVAQVDGNKWALSIRGFTDFFADKLLVLIDGRSVYTHTFAGVLWDEQDLPMDDVERIEVIRGPGGSLWGSNAVNGVINVITKHARDTQGDLAVVGIGDVDNGIASVRHGTRLRSGAFLRTYGRVFSRGSLAGSAGDAVADEWDSKRAGFRVDRELAGGARFMAQGGIFENHIGTTLTQSILEAPYERTVEHRGVTAGFHALARWEQATLSGKDRSFQVFVDRARRDWGGNKDARQTFDLDFQQRQPLGTRHDLTWGLGFRQVRDRMSGSFAVRFTPTRFQSNLFSAFLHDAITLSDSLRLSVGSKFEIDSHHHDLQSQPSARLLWTPDARHTYWASVSRAVRAAHRVDHDIWITLGVIPGQGGPATVLALLGNEAVHEESAVAYEAGARFQPSDALSLDIAAFSNAYHGIIGAEGGRPFMVTAERPPYLVVPLYFANNLSAKTYGLEATGQWRVTDRWRLVFGGTLFRADVRGRPSNGRAPDTSRQRNGPEQMLHLRSSLDLPRNLEFDALYYYVSRLEGAEIPGYSRLDLRLGWRPSRQYEVSVGVQNLLSAGHREFSSSFGETPSPVGRRIFGKVTLHR